LLNSRDNITQILNIELEKISYHIPNVKIIVYFQKNDKLMSLFLYTEFDIPQGHPVPLVLSDETTPILVINEKAKSKILPSSLVSPRKTNSEKVGLFRRLTRSNDHDRSNH